MGDAMLIDIFERVFNRDEGVKIKIKKHFGTISIDIVDIHAGTNDIGNNKNYLRKIKKIVPLVRETCQETHISLFFNYQLK